MGGVSAVGHLPSAGLRNLARRSAESLGTDPAQRCDLCAEELAETHRHLLDTSTGELSCACAPCGILFDHHAAGGGHYRLIRTRPRSLDDFVLDAALWAGLAVPVGLAFFVRSGEAGEVTAFYPNPMGTMRARVEPASWQALVEANPVLVGAESDVEALFVNRVTTAHEHWLLPLDDCYRLVAVLRSHWTGFHGGTQVWQQVESFFSELMNRGANSHPREEGTW